MAAGVKAARPHGSLLWLVAIGIFMQTLDSTIVDTALPAMAHSLGESPIKMQSVVIAYVLTVAILIPASGWIADRFGTRRVFFAAILLFSIGSLFCAWSETLTQLVLSRILQGAGGAMLLPVGRLAVLRAVPRDEFLEAISFVAVPGLIGPLIGPTLGGWLVQYASWHWIFKLNIPVGVIGCIATLAFMPDYRGNSRHRFDIGGYLLLALSMAAISLALDGLADLGFTRVTVLLLLLLGLVCLASYWLRAAQRPAPLFSLSLFRNATFRIGLIGNLFARIGSGSMPFLIPLLLQVGLGYTPAQAGMMMIPTAAAAILSKRFGTSLIHRVGYRRVLLLNTVLVGLTMASFAVFSSAQPLWVGICQLFLFGGVNSLQFTAMNTVTLMDLGAAEASSGNSLLSMVQMLSMSLGVASAGALLALLAEAFHVAGGPALLPVFHMTFVCVGLITAAAACIFWQLPSGDGPQEEAAEPLEMG